MQLNTSKRQGGWVGRKNVLPLILCSEKKNSYVIVGISPLGTTRGVGDLSEEDQVSRRSMQCVCVCVCVLDRVGRRDIAHTVV